MDHEETQNLFEFTSTSNQCNDITASIAKINDRICKMLLNHNETNQVYEICIDLLDKTQQLNEMFMKKENGMNAIQALKMSTTIIKEELSQCLTRFKRDKRIERNKLFVPPQEKAIGVRWVPIKLPHSSVSVPRLISNVYQEISIIKSIVSLFNREDFRKEYYLFNEEQTKLIDHKTYTNFSNSGNFKNNELFKNHPNSLQLEVGQDDFEPLNALGSKATLYKLSPVYISVKNIPSKFASKLSNILLSSLSHTDDLKTQYTDWNDIWLGLVHELRQIEHGIVLDDGTTIKGTVVSVVSDNLGANSILGFVKNFSKAKYPCRFCFSTLDEIRTLCHEIQSKRRTKEHYEEQLLKIKNAEKVDLTDTFGVAMHCALNELKFYHMIDSMTPDIMHDIEEGAIPFLLKPFFEHMFKHKVCTESDLKNKIKWHDFEFKHKKNVPTELNINKSCLGQNASQMLCLFQSIPFILYDYKNNEFVKKVWICVETLLKIVQIVYSDKIDENNLNNLNEFVRIHLENFQKLFGNLKFKQHILTHLVSTIIAMGSLKWFSMKRYEAKHKEIKGCIGDSHNLRNMTKTIAHHHQQMMSIKKHTYTDHFEHAKVMKPIGTDFLNCHKEILPSELAVDNENIKEIFELKWMNYNIFHYANDFFIQFEIALYQIEKVLLSENEYYFFCSRFRVTEYCSFLNSIKIEIVEPKVFKVIKFNQLVNKNVYEAKHLNNERYIILDTLDLKYLYE